ncbi:hypothetical protein [Sphingomonas sp. Leaf343]|uniref:hypothetical protein n=1 Tax=Sphingomonas sp. Leaf343 TaxID=1736345 RepID=UPI0006F289B1|nr:hypothetical protein [Sphingomonas sp. Leaf343]KQR87990.1 hypothetical protein ASG07_03845 [Sphingomonas sp. Leaf343]
MRLMIATALILGPATATVAQTANDPARSRQHCKPGTTMASRSAPRAGVQRLDRMPPATVFRTVYREVDGCPTPVTLRTGIGNPTAPPTGR